MLKIGQKLNRVGDQYLVTAIHGDQRPSTVQSDLFSGAVVSGGNAEFDLVSLNKENPSILRRVPEAIIRSRPWVVCDEADSMQALMLESMAINLERERERQREKDDQEKADATARGEKLLADHIPAWAKGVIVAIHETNVSDSQTDYFNATTGREVIIGWSKHTRKLFPEMRKAALRFPETSHLGPNAAEDIEHRENYSMGGGMYLKDGSRYSTGWKIAKYDLGWDYTKSWLAEIAGREGLDHVVEKPESKPLKAETMQALKDAWCDDSGPDVSGPDVSVSRNAEKNGIEVVFASKPEAGIRAMLKGNGFRWSRRQGLWYARYSAERWTFAESLAG